MYKIVFIEIFTCQWFWHSIKSKKQSHVIFQAKQLSCSLAYVVVRNGTYIKVIFDQISFDVEPESIDTMSSNF